MRNLLLLFAGALLITSCTGSTGQGTVIPNPSAEEGTGSLVNGWTGETRGGSMIAFYDYEAHQGKRSLMLQSNRPSGGRWMTKVELKPWSEYRFTGWVKTEGVQSRGGKGAGFRLDAFDAEYTGLTGTNDWTKIEFVFKTGNDDSSVLSCLLGLDGPASGRAWFDDMSLELISSEKLNTAVTIDLADKKEPMSEYIYGQFIEHLGRCIYGGIWAEMLEDRKFWYVPGERESPWQV
ncbi:MAG: alpha-L-arabinofuranosidase, partial [Bacteroidetes bacterium]